MTEEERKIWKEKFDLKRGFDNDEIKEFNDLVINTTHCEFEENKDKYIKFLNHIINHPHLDYISKLEKIYTLLSIHKGLKRFYEEYIDFSLSINKIEDNNI